MPNLFSFMRSDREASINTNSQHGRITVSRSAREITINIRGQFVFCLHQQFRNAYLKSDDREGMRFIVDMASVDYLDTSAIGMLLMMREEIGVTDDNISIVNVNDTVSKTLETVNMDRWFTIAQPHRGLGLVRNPHKSLHPDKHWTE